MKVRVKGERKWVVRMGRGVGGLRDLIPLHHMLHLIGKQTYEKPQCDVVSKHTSEQSYERANIWKANIREASYVCFPIR